MNDQEQVLHVGDIVHHSGNDCVFIVEEVKLDRAFREEAYLYTGRVVWDAQGFFSTRYASSIANLWPSLTKRIGTIGNPTTDLYLSIISNSHHV